MGKNHVDEKRIGKDRRQDFITPKFPFYDCGGCLVARDRRTLADRRVDGITVEWISDQELVLEMLSPADGKIAPMPI